MQDFTLIKPEALTDNVFKLLDKDWMLITAGTIDHYNTMTASWGHMGIMWNLPVAMAWIRPQRYTFEFTEKYSHFTLSFFSEEHRRALKSFQPSIGNPRPELYGRPPAQLPLKDVG